MAFHQSYRRQVALLLRVMPFIAEEDSFALKGGTAINLFVRDLPRLSVDIDLTYLPLLPRARSPVPRAFESGAPDWDLLAVPKADRLPAVKWRQQNLAKLTRNKRIALVGELEAVLRQPATPLQFTLFPEPATPKPKRRKR
jgi:hypothetical protein